MNERPLFIPLKTAYFAAFEDGSKRDELRKYSARWNEVTCRIGRPVILSHGYGGKRRLSARVESFRKVRATELPPEQHAAVLECYGHDLLDIAVIGVCEVQPQEGKNTLREAVHRK